MTDEECTGDKRATVLGQVRRRNGKCTFGREGPNTTAAAVQDDSFVGRRASGSSGWVVVPVEMPGPESVWNY